MPSSRPRFRTGSTAPPSRPRRQRSVEYDKARNGVFTHYLLEGLAGAADKDADSRIDLYEAHLYARRRTQRWGLQKGILQNRVLKGEI